MRVEVVYATPALQKLVTVEVEQGSSARQAAMLSGLDRHFPELDLSTVPLGIFGEKVKDGAQLQPGDRIELYRKLLIDPMQARRERAKGA